jgi:hypothetical protein
MRLRSAKLGAQLRELAFEAGNAIGKTKAWHDLISQLDDSDGQAEHVF